MYIAATPEANHLLETSPLALLIGMLLDQQITMEKAFTSPAVLAERMGGSLDAAQIANTDPDELQTIFATPPALHRFPGSMAKRVQDLCRVLVERYDGGAEQLWKGVTTGDRLLERVAALPGFGEQKAKIFVALLGKQYGVRPRGWRQASGDYGVDGSTRSVADVVDDASLQKVRTWKKEQKAAARAVSA